MAIIATSQISIVDLSDGKSLSCYITSNLPKTQILDPNPSGSTSPDWSGNPKLILTPVVFANQTALALNAAGLSITWKRKEGAGAEAATVTGEAVSGGVLTISTNKLTGVTSGLLTYLCYVTYTDPDTGIPVNVVADITFSQIKTALNAKTAYISGEQVFKYDATSAVIPAQITLTANVANVTVSKWQYKAAIGDWMDYPTTADNTSITGGTLNVKPTHAIFVGDTATLRVVTSEDGVTDVMTIYKVRDGATGTAGSAGASAPTAFLTNENVTFAGNASGQVAAVTKTCNAVAYRGTSKITPTVGTVTGAPTGMTVTAGEASNNEIPLFIVIAANATLGGTGAQQGELSVPITAPVATTLKIHWSKVNTGATGAAGADGADGADAIVFSLYAPSGTVFVNGEGTLTIQTAAYKGTTAITTGATFAWKKYISGAWTAISGQTGASLSVTGSTVDGVASFQCTMTYGGKAYTDTISLTDKTDNFQASIESSGGDVFKNAIGTSTLLCRLFQNGAEVDATGTDHTYKWYRRDKDGNAMDSGAVVATSKSLVIDGDDVSVKTTFICEVE
ncbi:MAG: hypothetical protein RSI33_06135 [Clostridia bacterium]